MPLYYLEQKFGEWQPQGMLDVTPVMTDLNSGEGAPEIANDGYGQTYAFFLMKQSNGTTAVVYMKFDPKTKWGAPQVFSPAVNAERVPVSVSAMTDHNQTLHVFWTSPEKRRLEPRTIQIFTLQTLFHSQSTAQNQWSEPRRVWTVPNRPAAIPAAGVRADGRVVVFSTRQATDNVLAATQPQTSSDGWTIADLGDRHVFSQRIAVATNQDRRLEIFYIAHDGFELCSMWELQPGSGKWSNPNSFRGNYALMTSAARNADGRLEIVYIGTNNQLHRNFQTKPNGGWHGEVPMKVEAQSVALGPPNNYNLGALNLLYVGLDGTLWSMIQLVKKNSWTTPKKVGQGGGNVSIGRRPNGDLLALSC